MEKTIGLLIVVSLVLGMSLAAAAVSFEGDASILFGLGENKRRGLAIHGRADVYEELFADASFVTSSPTGDGTTEAGQSLLTLGGLYRVVHDSDLQVFVGGGWTQLTAGESKGHGLYGKFGFKLIAMPKLTLTADVAYAFKYAVGEQAGSLTAARATLAYDVAENVAVQGTIHHQRALQAETLLLVGGGVAFRF